MQISVSSFAWQGPKDENFSLKKFNKSQYQHMISTDFLDLFSWRKSAQIIDSMDTEFIPIIRDTSLLENNLLLPRD